jgi:glucuronokinase
MRLIRKKAFARAGLIGNPSDGYHGRTISISVRNFAAEAVLYEWDQVEVVWSQEDQSRFRSVRDLADDVRLHGYYGGVRLVKATIKKFVEYCDRQEQPLHEENFSIRYESTIPRQVGLAGSSAIIIATLRCLMEFYDVAIPQRVLPSLALAVETGELGIAAGLQDRVIQTYEGVVAMDFARETMEDFQGFSCGVYTPVDAKLLPPLYVAYDENVCEPTEILHDDLRSRFERGDPVVVAAMKQFADYAAEALTAIESGDHARLRALIDANFDLRNDICVLPDAHRAMIRAARSAGASAKFAGSGGAIIGTYSDDATYERLTAALESLHCRVIRPQIAP